MENDLTKCVGGNLNDVVHLSADILQKPGGVDVEDNSIDIARRSQVCGKIFKDFAFRKIMIGLSPHRLPLKKRMKD